MKRWTDVSPVDGGLCWCCLALERGGGVLCGTSSTNWYTFQVGWRPLAQPAGESQEDDLYDCVLSGRHSGPSDHQPLGSGKTSELLLLVRMSTPLPHVDQDFPL